MNASPSAFATAATPPSPPPRHPRGFRARRGLNWGVVGLMYTSFYMCRYNFSIANKSISDEFGWSKADVGSIISTMMLVYAFGQILNGLLSDRIGGKKTMLLGAAGTIVFNILFGVASHAGLLWLFVLLRGIDGYFQAAGAPGMIKINVAWFPKAERGRFAGIFGFMINLGRFGIFNLGPSLLAGFLFLGLWQVPPLHWRWLFWVPAGIAALVAALLALCVKNTPEEAGFAGAVPNEGAGGNDTPAPSAPEPGIREVVRKIAGNPVIWIVAAAYACTGAVRQGIDQWFPRYMQEVFSTDLRDAKFQLLAFMIPFVASAGSLVSCYVSDLLFKGRRAPVAAGIYVIETAIIASAAMAASVNAVIVFFVLISFTANSTHSLLGTAAAMDIGGRKMAGFASGVIDSFQYFGGFLSGWLLGALVDANGWAVYFWFLMPFGVTGGLLMLLVGRVSRRRGVAL
ncbi:MAG: MFS transporter [Opitutaceae bacterium]|jgi:OPA family glycerol-3-phosphate transporter-like MFS transporter|nr:MFS transporter [Opitutaceae bacterium]